MHFPVGPSPGPVYYSRDLQILYLAKKNFKTGSHDTIHIFKNYFATVFSVFSNKRYPNRPLLIFDRFDTLDLSPGHSIPT